VASSSISRRNRSSFRVFGTPSHGLQTTVNCGRQGTHRMAVRHKRRRERARWLSRSLR
jgi:hypothetical protein